MDPTSTSMYDGKVYLLRVKPSLVQNWNDDDIIYAAAHEGGAGLSFHGIKNICEKKENKWIVTKKINKNNDDSKCCWSDVLATMEESPPIGRTTVSSTTRVTTFLEIATRAYKEGIFSDSEGKKKIESLNKKNKTTPSDPDKVAGPYDSPAEMIRQAKLNAESVSKQMADIDMSNMAQGDKQLIRKYNLNPPTVPEDLAAVPQDEMIKLVKDLQDRDVFSREHINELIKLIASKNDKLEENEKEIAELKIQLESAMAGNTGFMAAADKAAIENKALSNDLAAEVVKGLKPFINSQLNIFTSALKPFIDLPGPLRQSCTKVANIETSVQMLSSNLKNHTESSSAINDANHEAAMECIGEVKDALAGAGISAEVPGTDIPKTLVSMDAALRESKGPVQGSGTPVPTKHEGECTYKSTAGHPSTLSCTQGCGSQIHMKNDSSSIPIKNPGTFVQAQNSGSFQSPPPGYQFSHPSATSLPSTQYSPITPPDYNSNRHLKRKINYSSSQNRIQNNKQQGPTQQPQTASPFVYPPPYVTFPPNVIQQQAVAQPQVVYPVNLHPSHIYTTGNQG